MLKAIATDRGVRVAAEVRKDEHGCLSGIFRFRLNHLPDLSAEPIGTLDGIDVFDLGAAENVFGAGREMTLLHPWEVELDETVKLIIHEVERINPSRVVFDSLSEMRLLAHDPLRYRREILTLKQFFARRKTTVLLLDDLTGIGGQQDLQLHSISHGVITLERLTLDFIAIDDRLDCEPADLLVKRPAALIDLFRVWVDNPHIKGLRADLLIRIEAALDLIGSKLADDHDVNVHFLRVLRRGASAVEVIARMNRHGVLARYLPAFGSVVGRMQYDLFHAYTVDAHTLFVVSNLRRFAMPKFNHEFPALSQIMQSLPRQEVAYLAALFHDIAKGRGGDHSDLGAVDAEAFCLEQGMGRYEARLVAWLVRNHLTMSLTAQRQLR